MAKSSVYSDRGSGGDIDINMTPMIDVVFQLIIFFILASQFASKEIAKLTLPVPHEKQIIREKDIKNRRIIINILSMEDPMYHEKGERVVPGRLAWYEIMGEKIYELEAGEKLQKRVEEAHKAAKEAGRKDFFVEVRADYRVAYEYVARALVAAGAAGVEKAHIGVSLGDLDEDKGK